MNTVFLADEIIKRAKQLQDQKLDLDFWLKKCIEDNQQEQTSELIEVIKKLNVYEEQLYISASVLKKAGDK